MLINSLVVLQWIFCVSNKDRTEQMMNYYPFSIFLYWELYVFVFLLFEVDISEAMDSSKWMNNYTLNKTRLV